VTGRPSAAELLERDGALLTRSHLAELGLTRTMIDAVFRTLDVVVFPGSCRPAVKREDYLDLLERCTYRDDRVRP
jgi:fructose-1-phosphate kinase PfkB-like protein